MLRCLLLVFVSCWCVLVSVFQFYCSDRVCLLVKFAMDIKEYGELSHFFTSAEWKAMPEYEKKRNCNILHNYRAMLAYGLSPKRPEFMRRSTDVGRKNELRRSGSMEQEPVTPEDLARDLNEDFLGFSVREPLSCHIEVAK